MTDQQRRVNARRFREWYELLEETVTHDEDAVAPGNSRSAVMLLHDLVGVGLRSGAVRLVVSRSTGPRRFSHLSFRYPLDQAFDWREDIAFSPEGEYHGRAEQLIMEIENETGIDAEDDSLVAIKQKDGTTP
jgi:hypothetical protein